MFPVTGILSPEMASANVRIEKATSDLLIGPDWTLNMEICDSINSDHWQTKDIMKAVKKRLQHKNPKVQFLALTLLETMIKNCGEPVHFQVVEREILQEMVKIVRKKTDMQVRDKILVLLDSWQVAFGGPGGKYPQYYSAFLDLKRSGVEFPQRPPDSALIFSPPINLARPMLPRSQAGYGMPSTSAVRLEEAMAAEMANLSLSDLSNIRSVMELLRDMLLAVNPNDQEAVRDEVIVDLADQCRTNQKRLMQLVTSTGDEELLGQGLELNDNMQILLAKFDAIASGSYVPTEASDSSSKENAVVPSVSATQNVYRDEKEEEDEFAQLAHRNRPVTTECTSIVSCDLEASPHHSDSTSATTEAWALALPDPPAHASSTKEQDMIDLLSLTLTTDPSPTSYVPSSSPNQHGFPFSTNSNGQGQIHTATPNQASQGYIPSNNYVAPWAQQSAPQSGPQLVPQPQQFDPSQQHMQSQPQTSSYSSSYPPPPWATPNSNPFEASTYQVPSWQNSIAGSHSPTPAASRPVQSYASFGPRVYNAPSPTVQPQVNTSPRPANNTSAPKTFIPSYRLFEDLVDLKNTSGPKAGGTSLPGMSGHPMVGERK